MAKSGGTSVVFIVVLVAILSVLLALILSLLILVILLLTSHLPHPGLRHRLAGLATNQNYHSAVLISNITKMYSVNSKFMVSKATIYFSVI